jgi:hypothetical protein
MRKNDMAPVLYAQIAKTARRRRDMRDQRTAPFAMKSANSKETLGRETTSSQMASRSPNELGGIAGLFSPQGLQRSCWSRAWSGKVDTGFRKDHAPPNIQSAMTIQPKAIAL